MDEQTAIKARVRRRAERQAGRISRAQLLALGVGRGQIEHWLAEEYLVRVHPGVYACGHCARSVEGELWAAVLYAGPGAMLSHMTAAWWRGLIEYPPSAIHVSTHRRSISLPGVIVHRERRRIERWAYQGVPVTSMTQTMLDLAASAELLLVRKALGRLDFRDQLDREALLRACGKGRPGSAALTHAINIYDPRFGLTNGPLADRYLLLCERENVPKPDEIECWLHGIRVDAHYVEARLVVELDGEGNHGKPAQRGRDHRNDMTLRRHGLAVLRYSWEQVVDTPRDVAEEVIAKIAERTA